MSKLQNMRIVEIPKFRAVSSGPKPLQALFDGPDSFDSWIKEHKHLFAEHIFEPQDLLWHEEKNIDKSVWIMPIKADVQEADVFPYSIIEFPGGIFLVATGDEKDDADLNETVGNMLSWIERSPVFEYGDFPESGMCNMPNPDGLADRALNIAQQQIFLPLKIRHGVLEEAL